MNKSNQQSGFTLIEMFIAILIFSLTLTAFLLVTTRGITTTRDAVDEVTAQFLAQEGIEMIEAKRDYNFIRSSTGVYWSENIVPNNCDNAAGCLVNILADIDDDEVVKACVTECPLLEIDGGGRYGYNLTGGQETNFRRTVFVNSLPNSFNPGDNALRVTSLVEWQTSTGAERSLTLEKTIMDWFTLQANI